MSVFALIFVCLFIFNYLLNDLIIIIIILNIMMQRVDLLVFALTIHIAFLLFKKIQEWHLYASVISSPLRSIILILSKCHAIFLET